MIQILLFVGIFLIGLAVGSFLNSVIYRLKSGESFLLSRSFCPLCRHPLKWQDLIPVFSFIFLKAKCRYCSQKISWQYPLVELATGILFLLIWQKAFLGINGGPTSVIFGWLMTSFLIIIFVYDLKHFIIPDRIIYPAIGIAFLYQLFRVWHFDLGFISDFGFRISDFKTLINPLSSAFLASAFFLALVLVSKGKWMGLGDVKLAFLMGLILGFPNILTALFLAFFIGAIIGAGLMIAGKKTLKSEVPFGPFLVAGTIIALFLGQNLINWYLNFFLYF